MKKALIGKKLGMTQIFDENGTVIPVTVIEAGPCVVAQVKTIENDGYEAVQLGFGEVKENKLNKPVKGHFAKAKLPNKKHLREFRLDSVENYKVGDEVKVKAAGGIRDLKTALAMIEAGAERLGTSAGVAIVEEYNNQK